MSRHIIAYEGKPSLLPNTWLDKGSLYIHLDSLPIPVTRGFNWEEPPIGVASDLQRDEETGAVSVEIKFKPGFELSEEEEKLYDFSFFATHLVEQHIPATDEIPGYRLVTGARLREVAMVPNAAIPKSRSQEIQGP